MFARDTHVCDHIDTKTRAVYGFSTWLAGIIEGLDKNADADPQGQPDDIKYSSDFAVVKDNKLGVDFNVVFLSGSASAENNRNDVQSIKFTIAPQSKDNPPPDVYDRFK
ncbi:hypothetical protein B5V01_18070 [Mesorhizobium erdmanii]|uniref:Uncharacterized protein n=3 Tax=Phyllobacteriaceae TaxID=69277 RepID=A0A3M9X6F3_9HYPH|nr:hypothetical protein DNR46_23465 [Mesorhizobium japonicum]RXT43781.1 hypothetical protein B5V01_18070 [Mesorhizobium erdmanii]